MDGHARLTRAVLMALCGLFAAAPAYADSDHNIRPEENLHFLPIIADLAPNYTAITITSDDYPELVAKDAPVKTIAVGTVLVAYNWPAKSERYQRVDRFVQAFFAHLEDIKARRPKWGNFDVSASVAGWTRFPTAERWLKKAELAPEPNKVTVQEDVHPDPRKRDALFQAFADYLKTSNPRKQLSTSNRNNVKRCSRRSPIT